MDALLLRRSLSGDADAFRALYDRTSEAVYGYALRITGERGAAEDVTQDVYLALVRRGSTYDPARPFLSWLLALTRHAAIDHLRRRRVRSAKPVDRALIETAKAPAAETDAGELVESALARLPSAYRETVWLCDGMGLSYGEASSVLNCDVNTIGSRISRGRRMLRDHFARNGHAM